MCAVIGLPRPVAGGPQPRRERPLAHVADELNVAGRR